MEALVDVEPEGVTVEIAHGVYCMSPRPRPRHGFVQLRLGALLEQRLGGTGVTTAGLEWLFAVEVELRHQGALSRLVPDLAGWKKSTTGWPDPDVNPVDRMPEWVAEILSPGTKDFDRTDKRGAYGFMSVAWLWLVDPDAKKVEVFENIRGAMNPTLVLEGSAALSAPPFGDLGVPLASIFP
jgi:Uma2 family endonuclease